MSAYAAESYANRIGGEAISQRGPNKPIAVATAHTKRHHLATQTQPDGVSFHGSFGRAGVVR